MPIPSIPCIQKKGQRLAAPSKKLSRHVFARDYTFWRRRPPKKLRAHGLLHEALGLRVGGELLLQAWKLALAAVRLGSLDEHTQRGSRQGLRRASARDRSRLLGEIADKVQILARDDLLALTVLQAPVQGHGQGHEGEAVLHADGVDHRNTVGHDDELEHAVLGPIRW